MRDFVSIRLFFLSCSRQLCFPTVFYFALLFKVEWPIMIKQNIFDSIMLRFHSLVQDLAHYFCKDKEG